MSRKDSGLSQFVSLLLEHPSLHYQEICDKLDVERQSVYRYRQKLARHGVRVEIYQDNSQLPKGHLALYEEDKERLRGYSGLFVSGLASGVAGADATTYEKVASAFYSPHETYMVDGLFALVLRAIAERRVAVMRYLNAKGEEKSYRYNAYKLVVSKRRLHLLGVDHNTLYEANLPNEIQRRRLDQIVAFELTEKTFAIPDGVDIEAYANYAFAYFDVDKEAPGRFIQVHFRADKAQSIARTQRHITQEELWQDDGSVVWQAEMPLSDELVSWIMGYGGAATVLEPPELREQVHRLARASLKSNER